LIVGEAVKPYPTQKKFLFLLSEQARCRSSTEKKHHAEAVFCT